MREGERDRYTGINGRGRGRADWMRPIKQDSRQSRGRPGMRPKTDWKTDWTRELYRASGMRFLHGVGAPHARSSPARGSDIAFWISRRVLLTMCEAW